MGNCMAGHGTKSLWKKIMLWGSGVIGGGIAVFLFLLFYEGSTEPIIAIADKFHPDSSWELVSERVEPPRIACLNDVACPSLHRMWRTEHALSYDELKRFVQQSGLDMTIEGDCLPKLNLSGVNSMCSANGESNKMSVTVNVIKDDYNEESKVTLGIQ